MADSAAVTQIRAQLTEAQAKGRAAANHLREVEAQIAEVHAQAKARKAEIVDIEARMPALAAPALLGDTSAAKALGKLEEAREKARTFLRHYETAQSDFIARIDAAHAPLRAMAPTLTSLEDDLHRQLKAEQHAEEATRKALLRAA